MTRVVFVNGRYHPYAEAGVHAEDRGNLFGDAVYEVCEVRGGQLVDEHRHIARLRRSLAELRMTEPMSERALGRVMRESIRRNRVVDGLVYIQVSRGAGPRDFLFPPPGRNVPTLIVLARSVRRDRAEARAANGISVTTVPETRWERVDIKTVMLLPSVLAKEAAREQGASEAWFVDAQGRITEGGSSNAWIVDRDGRLITRPANRGILRGITREVTLELAQQLGMTVEERPFTVEEARTAREAFITSATNIVMPVTRIDGRSIGNGKPGDFATRLRARYHDRANSEARR
jgi:D-alanine transaminase